MPYKFKILLKINILIERLELYENKYNVYIRYKKKNMKKRKFGCRHISVPTDCADQDICRRAVPYRTLFATKIRASIGTTVTQQTITKCLLDEQL